MQYVIKIDTENDAFGDVPGFELARILRGLADRCEWSPTAYVSMGLRDSNGNTVGSTELVEDTCHGWTNWDTREVFTRITNSENWHQKAVYMHVDELRDNFGDDVADRGIDVDSVNWVEVYAGLQDVAYRP